MYGDFQNFRNFNSHAHVERDNIDNSLFKCYTNFNSHAHVERDNTAYTATLTAEISTHTLTWSVTSGITGNMVQF